MSYARARLWLGISGVGTLVVLCLIALVFRIPALLLHTGVQPIWRDTCELAAVLFIYAAAQGAFDFFGGHILPTEYGRTQTRFGSFLRGWLRGVVIHSAILLLVGITLIGAARAGGFWGAMGTFLSISLFLLGAQTVVAGWVGGVRYRDGGHTETSNGALVTLVLSDSPYFTGGIAGIPGFERLLVPARWRDVLSPDEWAIALRRRSGSLATGTRNRGLALALGFNLAGFALACILSGGTASVAGLVTTSIGFTLWSFLGLLVLPAPSQQGVFETDAFAQTNGADTETLAGVIRKLDRQQDDEPARAGGVERIFHPIPSVERRLARLAAPEAGGTGAWHAARMAIYLSWAGMSFLSRAVHCNAGRPDAWVFLPSD